MFSRLILKIQKNTSKKFKFHHPSPYKYPIELISQAFPPICTLFSTLRNLNYYVLYFQL
jgi:hypothetical protein